MKMNPVFFFGGGGGANFHKDGFTRRLVLAQSPKWPDHSSYEFLLFLLSSGSVIELQILLAGSPSFVSIRVERI